MSTSPPFMPSTQIANPGLHDLASIPLTPAQDEAMGRLAAVSLGSASWQTRKRAELRELFALERITDRLRVIAVDPTTDLRLLIELQTPVATWPPGATDIVVESRARLAIIYPEALLRSPLPGPALVDVLEPRHVFLANVTTRGPAQPLCLGANVPRGFPLREAILACYASLSMQSVASDERDPAGIMQVEAALYWQRNRDRIPLCTEPFLARMPGATS